MSNNNRRDVSPNSGNGWKVTKPGSARPTAKVSTQGAAESIAKGQVAKAGGGQVYIRRPSGVIRDADTVKPGNESSKKDTKH